MMEEKIDVTVIAPVLNERESLTEERYRELQEQYPEQFTAGMGAEAIKELLARVDVDDLARELRDKMKSETS